MHVIAKKKLYRGTLYRGWTVALIWPPWQCEFLALSNLSTIIDSRNRQVMDQVKIDGKAIEQKAYWYIVMIKTCLKLY